MLSVYTSYTGGDFCRFQLIRQYAGFEIEGHCVQLELLTILPKQVRILILAYGAAIHSRICRRTAY